MVATPGLPRCLVLGQRPNLCRVGARRLRIERPRAEHVSGPGWDWGWRANVSTWHNSGRGVITKALPANGTPVAPLPYLPGAEHGAASDYRTAGSTAYLPCPDGAAFFWCGRIDSATPSSQLLMYWSAAIETFRLQTSGAAIFCFARDAGSHSASITEAWTPDGLPHLWGMVLRTNKDLSLYRDGIRLQRVSAATVDPIVGAGTLYCPGLAGSRLDGAAWLAGCHYERIQGRDPDHYARALTEEVRARFQIVL